MKKRLFGIILCVSMLLSSMSVLAGSATKYFNGNVAYLTAGNGKITASTDVVESGIPKIQIRPYGLDTYPWRVYNDCTEATYYISNDCAGAESYHYVGSSSAYLTATYG